MDSQQLFQSGPRSGRTKVVLERSRLIWVFLLSVLVPGGGHFVLGNVVLGSALLMMGILGTVTGFVARFNDFTTLGWFLQRMAVVAWVFSVLDSTLIEQERVDRRSDMKDPRSRIVGLLNALGWGIGFLRIGERTIGIVALLLGGALHVVLAMRGQPLVWIGEVATIALSFWGATKAEDRSAGGSISTEFGEMNRSGPVRVSRQDTTPSWYAPVVLSLVTLFVGAGVASWTVLDGWLDNRFVRSEGAVSVEPYYRHPEYGISLEMHSEGWAFREAPAETFVFAQHLSEDTRISLRLRPRMPFVGSDARAARMELAAFAPGLTPVSSEAVRFGGLEGVRLRASGMVRNRRTFVEILTAGEGFRRFVLHAEWTAGHEDFARRELDAVLANLSLADRVPSAAEPSLAR